MKRLVFLLVLLSCFSKVEAQRQIKSTVVDEFFEIKYILWGDSYKFFFVLETNDKNKKEKTAYSLTIDKNFKTQKYEIKGQYHVIGSNDKHLLKKKEFSYDPNKITQEELEKYLKKNFELK